MKGAVEQVRGAVRATTEGNEDGGTRKPGGAKVQGGATGSTFQGCEQAGEHEAQDQSKQIGGASVGGAEELRGDSGVRAEGLGVKPVYYFNKTNFQTKPINAMNTRCEH